MGVRTGRSSWIVLTLGLGILVLGVVLLLNDTATCTTTEMRAGNQCITVGDGGGVVRSLERQGDDRFAALLAIALGIMVAGAGVWLTFFADRSVVPATGVGDRIELARRHGWSFVDVDPELLADWSDTPDFGEGRPAYAVLRGTYTELDFVIFDFRRPGTGELSTAWIVYLPVPSRVFVTWATAQEPLYRHPLNMVGVRTDAIADIGARLHRSTEPDSVLRQVRALAEIVRRFEAQKAANS
ncbi:hypothetical protein [Actinoplanes utahensis]|uniref:Uncharacterized protein n=1 Tax=Actinoplanes utahensis TaxID=1869 RepID=A0A0A6UHS0_ACTUT|nr:hypothetical protein [Actinoplanes utahensis]KHD73854.1 hypothetical protein MB27_33035 [Actinoplanes utahensis]GIF27754.1 hypothetical protein Aut01nite_07400 [Actinoplanes utahensis]